MELNEIKKQMVIVSRDKERAAKMQEIFLKDDDCFGKGYSETAEPCGMCNVIVEFDGRRDCMSGWCRKFTLEFRTDEPECEDKR